MSFKRWFKWWIRSWERLILHGSRRPKSEDERRLARAKRRDYERRKHNPLYTVKKRKKARSSNAMLLDKIGGVFAAALAFFLIPFGLFKRAKRGKKIKTAVAHATVKRASLTSAKSSVNSSHKEDKKEVKTEVKTEKKVERKPTTSSAKSPSNSSATREKREVKREQKKEEQKPILQENVRVSAIKIDDKKDENSPKTSPKYTGDIWIRKRMIVEIKSEEMAEEIKIGDTFDLALAEDKSVVLARQNSPIATVCKADTLPLATALKLGRKLYAVVVDIKGNEIEFEGWQRQ